MLKTRKALALTALLALLAPMPSSARSAENVALGSLAGTWYEIARTDHMFERNLINTAADCAIDGDGTLTMATRGLNGKTNRWTRIAARARAAENARLEIMFLGFFPIPYRIVDIDDDYAYALIASDDLGKMWLLSREKSVSDDVIERYLGIARARNVSTENLIRVIQRD